VAGGKSEQNALNCDLSTDPHNGMCGCYSGVCAFKPADPRSHGTSTSGVCKKDGDCVVDYPTGTCYVQFRAVQGSIKVEGPYCRCNVEKGICELEWYGPVPCSTRKECGYSKDPVIHAVKGRTKDEIPVYMVLDCIDGYCFVCERLSSAGCF
jgi:hypothetical protein